MGKIKGLLGIVIVVGGFYYAWNMVPPYFNNYQFQDDLDDVARKVSYLTRSDDEVKDMVIKKAATENIALKEDQITISRNGDGIGISVKYRVHVDMAVHPVDVDFTANSLNKRL